MMQTTIPAILFVLFCQVSGVEPFSTVVAPRLWQQRTYLAGTRLRSSKNPQEDPYDLVAIDREVFASVQEEMDKKRIMELLQQEEGSSFSSDAEPQQPMSQWNISLAAAAGGSALSFFLFHDAVFAALVGLGSFYVANQDPLDEDNVVGALARLLGRTTIRTVEASQPKVKAMARAAVTGEEEIVMLKRQLKQLQQENESLRQWKRHRIQVDDCVSQFALDDLKQKARSNNLAVGGTKVQILMRLVEAEVIDLSSVTTWLPE